MTTAAPARLIVDTDLRGLNDDAFALHYLVARGRIPDLVTTVFGNTTPEASAADARRLCRDLRLGNVRVESGAGEPVDWSVRQRARMRKVLDALPDGTYLAGIAPDGPLFRPTARDSTAGTDCAGSADGAVPAMVEVLSSPSDCTVLALGPLTNVALACARSRTSDLARHRLVVSGGSLRAGNVTDHSEFNAFADPYALRQVLTAPWKSVTVVPLDVTQRVDFGAPEVARLGATRTRFGDAVVESRRLLHRQQPQLRELMWDAVVAVVLLCPTVVRAALRGQVEVETRPPHYGHLRLASPQVDRHVQVVTGIDAAALRDEFVAAFEEWVS